MSSPQPHTAGQILPFRQSLLAILGMCFVMMMVALDQTVVGTALPTIVAELRGFDLYAWVATSYLLTSVITVPVFGRLGDFYGRKPFVVAAISLFTLASVLCGAATSMPMLVAARALQGVGGGMLIGTAFACVPDLFPEPRVRLKWQVLVSSAFGLANAVGPSLGGVLTEHYGWRSVFYVNLPVGLLGVYFVGWHMPHLRHPQKGRIQLDWPGAVLIALALGSLQLLVELMPQGFGASLALLGLGSVAAFVALYFWEKRCAHPLLPLEMFRSRAVSVLFQLALLMGVGTFAVMFYVPLMLQGGFGLSPQEAGLLVTPMAVFITVGSIINGRIITRIKNPNVMLYVGFGMLAMSSLGVITTTNQTAHWLIAVYMMLNGLGIGFVMPNVTVFAQHTAERAQLGIVTATLQSMRMVGGMVGTAVVGTIVTHGYLSRVTDTLRSGKATQWLDELHNPQVLLDPSTQANVLQEVTRQGHDGTSLLEGVRLALVHSIHDGQYVGLIMALLALWLVRRVPPVRLHRDAQRKPEPPQE